MGFEKRPPLKKQQTDDEASTRGRARNKNSSSNLFFRSSSASNLFKLRNSFSPIAAHNQSTKNEASIQLKHKSIGDDTSGIDTIDNHHMVDVLPSFEMYNTLHRNIPRGNVNPDQHDLPPSYQEVQNQQPELSDGTTVSQLDDVLLSPSFSLYNTPRGSTQSLQSMTTSPSNVVNNTLHSLSTRYEAIIDDLDDSDSINIDKLYSLPKVSTPIDVNIRILKKATKPYEGKPEEESILKEYTSGDIINGFVVIENRSQHPMRFEMFYVTLEGCTSVIDKKQGKRTVKRFLRMVDLSASWSYSNIDLATGFQFTPGDIDYDGCVLGLNNDRFLQPGVRYKKFFTFKLPTQLLDISCKHELFSHCLVPPSFGVDKYKHHARYQNIKLNSMLGYGHLGTKGSPILTNDLVTDNLSISYTIDARVVGKDSKTNELTIMKEKEYNLRFIPFGFCQALTGEGDPLKQVKGLQNLVEERIGALERVFDRLEKGECITANDIHNTDLSGTIDIDTNIDSSEILTRKLNQLHIDNRIDPDAASFPLRNVKNLKNNQENVESEFPYTIKYKSTSRNKLKKSFLGGFYFGSDQEHNQSVPDSMKCGIIMLECRIPKDGLPYVRPSLLKKTNQFSNKNKHDQSNWEGLQLSLLEEERNVLKHLDIHLRCIQANNSEPHCPPEIHSVSTQLICITSKAVSSFPIKLNTDLLLNREKIESIMSTFDGYLKKVREYKSKFKENSTELNKLYNKSRSNLAQQEIKFTDFIKGQLLNDIESLATLSISIKILNGVFKKQEFTLGNNIDTINSNGQHQGSKSESSSGLTTTFSNGSISSNPLSPHHSHNSTSVSQLMKQELTHEWVKTNDNEYARQVTVNLELDNEVKETLVPTFESCLCARMYCIRVNVKFENNVGTASIDIPIRIRNLEC